MFRQLVACVHGPPRPCHHKSGSVCRIWVQCSLEAVSHNLLQNMLEMRKASVAHRASDACSGEAMSHNLLQKAMVSELFLVVALTMALTPLLAEIGQRLGKAFEKSDVKAGPQHPQGFSPLLNCRAL